MNLGLFFDTETDGMIQWKKPSNSADQPHIVQLAALQVDMDTQKIIQSIDLIVRPDGREISPETTAIHGITTEHAMDVGITEITVFEMFIELWAKQTRIAFNTSFDNRIIRIAAKRYSKMIWGSDDIVDDWKQGSYGVEWQCAMQMARKAMKVKSVTLAEAYKHFIGKELEDAHTALADTNACMEVYFAIKNLNGEDHE